MSQHDGLRDPGARAGLGQRTAVLALVLGSGALGAYAAVVFAHGERNPRGGALQGHEGASQTAADSQPRRAELRSQRGVRPPAASPRSEAHSRGRDPRQARPQGWAEALLRRHQQLVGQQRVAAVELEAQSGADVDVDVDALIGARAEQLYQQWRGAEADPEYTESTQRHLDGALADLQLDVSVERVDCRAGVCRLELGLDDYSEGMTLMNMAGRPNEHIVIAQQPRPDRPTAIVYLDRQADGDGPGAD